MAEPPDPTWVLWGNHIRPLNTLKYSRFYNQWQTPTTQCCVRFWIPDENWAGFQREVNIYGDDETKVRFEVCGGESSSLRESLLRV